jgi:hypothetical protein
MLPAAADIAVNAVRDRAGSAQPNAPVFSDPARHESRVRIQFAAFLRASAQRRQRLADRLDSRSARMDPLAG